MYAKRGGVAAYHIVWIGLCLRSVPGMRVLASAVERKAVFSNMVIIGLVTGKRQIYTELFWD
jgi:hypothetical protein